jgi:hypothetical protein
MSNTPLADGVMAILRSNKTLGPELEAELRTLFSMSLDDLKAEARQKNQDPDKVQLSDMVASALAEKLGISKESGPTQEQSLRALYPSLENLRNERGNVAPNKPDDDRSVLQAMYPSMK